MDTFHQCVLLKAIYIYLVKDIGNVAALLIPQRYVPFASDTISRLNLLSSLLDTPIIAGLIDFQVQLLFVFRAYTCECLILPGLCPRLS